MTVDPSKARLVFISAVEEYPPDQWGKFLDEACGEDAELRRRVELLLKAHQGEDSMLDRGDKDEPAAPTIDQPITEKPGTQIGPYKLLQRLGEGGMGVVYMAEQSEPVERRVALKIIKPGMDTRQVIARFEAEEQALAMMDHPNIAKVLDAGTTDEVRGKGGKGDRFAFCEAPGIDRREVGPSRESEPVPLSTGRPYFVMELVKGIPITKYCDQQHLTPRERLDLFIPVCQAVQHAHQKGIIHRDLKPSNVLIALYDHRPVPKVIDFGVAKATSQKLTEKTMFTQYGQIVGTLEYMSPEQANLNQMDIDTRSDIYSLGVLLYELLTGNTPFDRQRLHSAAFDEMMRIIREEEPPKPSTRLSTIDTLPSVAANRKTEPKKLSALVRGELDWIVMKALEKDRTRRYETANGFANDIQRYLNDEPVVACPPSAGYRLRKFSRRNKATMVTASLIALALLVGLVGTSWQAVRATRAREEEAVQRVAAVAAREEEGRARQAAVAAKDEAETLRRNESTLRQKAEQSSEESRNRLVRLYVRRGSEHVNRGDYTLALPWFVKVLDTNTTDPQQNAIHRLRIATTLDRCPKLTRVWFGHDVETVQFYQDGERILLRSPGHATVLDRSTGRETNPELDGHFAELSGDGKRIVLLTHDGHARILDSITGKVLIELPTLADEPRFAGFSDDGTRLFVVYGKDKIRLWDVGTGNPASPPITVSSAIAWQGVRFCAEDKQLVIALNDLDVVEVWRLDTATEITRVSIGILSTVGRTMACFARSIAIPGGPFIRVYDAETGRLKFDPLRHADGVAKSLFSPDGRRLLSCGSDNTARLWDAETGESLLEPVCHTSGLGVIAFSTTGELFVTGSDDGTVCIWKTSNGKTAFPSLRHPDQITCAAFSPDDRYLITVSKQGGARIWDLASTYSSPLLVRKQGGRPIDIEFSNGDSRLTVGSGDLRTYDILSRSLTGPPHQIGGIVSLGGWDKERRRRLTASFDGTITLHDGTTGAVIFDNNLMQNTTHSIGGSGAWFAPDDERIFCHLSVLGFGRNRTRFSRIMVLDAKSGQPLFGPIQLDLDIECEVHNDDFWILGLGSTHSSSSRIEIRSLEGPRLLRKIPLEDTPKAMSLTADGKRLLVGMGREGEGEGCAQIFDLPDGKPVTPKMHTQGLTNFVGFYCDEHRVYAAGQDGVVRFWDARTGASAAPQVRVGRRITAIALHPSRLWFATGTGTNLLHGMREERLRFWDIQHGEPISPSFQQGDDVYRILFASNGDKIATTSTDGSVRVWKVPREERSVEDLRAIARVLTGLRLDETDSLVPVDMDAFRRLLAELTTRYPEEFRTTSGEAIEWYRHRADFYRRQNELERAVQQLSRLIELDPNVSGYTWQTRADIHSRLGNWTEAESDLLKAVSLQPGDCLFHYRLALLRLARGDLLGYRNLCAKMMQQIAESGETSDDHWLAWTCALAPEAVSDLVEAAEVAGRAVVERPNSDRHLNTLGAILYRAGRYEETVEWMNEIAERDSEQSRFSPAYTWFFLAMAHHQLGHEVEGRTWLNKAIAKTEEETQNDTEVAWNQRSTLGLLRTEAESLLAEPAVDAETSDENAPRPADEVKPSLSEPYRWVLHYRRARRFAAEGNWKEAASAFSQVPELAPDNYKLWEEIAQAHVETEQWKKAIEDYGQVIKLRPDDFQAWSGRAQACSELKQWDQAIADFSEAIRLNLNDDWVYKRRGQAYFATGRYEMAIADFSKALELSPDTDFLYRMRAQAYLQLDNYDRAISDCGEAIRLRPTYGLAYNVRAEAYLALENYDRAIEDCDEAIRLKPTGIGAYRTRARAYLGLENYDRAIEDYRQALKIKPTDSRHWLILDIEFARGASTETTQALVAEAEAALGGAGLLFQHAAWNLLLNRRDEYEKICRAAAARFADSTEPRELLSLARAAAIPNEPVLETEQLVEMASRAVEANPGAVYQHVLGLCLLRDGQADAAIERFNQSLGQSWTGAPCNWLGLAISHAADGRDSEAQDWLRKAQVWFEQNSLDLTSELHPRGRIECQLLLREAEQLIERKSSTEDDGVKKTP